jgi:hypothetical protein
VQAPVPVQRGAGSPLRISSPTNRSGQRGVEIADACSLWKSLPMMRPFLLVSLLALGACVSPRATDVAREGAHAPPLSERWLTGGWVLEGESCESDAGIIYNRNGSWIADGAAGRWKIKDGRLETIIVEQEDDAGAMIRLDPPARTSEVIDDAAADLYQIRSENGTVRRLTRCPG